MAEKSNATIVLTMFAISYAGLQLKAEKDAKLELVLETWVCLKLELVLETWVCLKLLFLQYCEILFQINWN